MNEMKAMQEGLLSRENMLQQRIQEYENIIDNIKSAHKIETDSITKRFETQLEELEVKIKVIYCYILNIIYKIMN